MIKTVLQDLFNFIKKPDDQQIKLSFKNKLLYIFILLIFELVVTYLFIIPVLEWIDGLVGLDTADTSYDTFVQVFIPAVIFAPLVEELIFRHLLRYQGIKTKVVSVNRWRKIFPYLVYSSSICFGLIHISNYANSSIIFLFLSPIIIISQLIGGMILAFIRVRLTFLWGVLYHAFWNLWVVIAIPTAEHLLLEPYVENTASYTIKIEEQLFFDDTEEQSIMADSTGGKIYSLNIKQYSVQHVLDTLYTKNKYCTGDILINLSLKSKNGIKKDKLLNILQKEYDIE